jgi:hypothetical protein
MNQLPGVLQKEIWEYVRGDRAYWKQQFSIVTAKLKRWNFSRVSRPIKGFTVRISNPIPGHFDINIFDSADDLFDYLVSRDDLKSANPEFEIWTKIVHREFGQIEIPRSKDGYFDSDIGIALYRARHEWQARSDSR